MLTNEKRVRRGCYGANLTMSVTGNLSPLLFSTFRNLYGVSYSLLGTLVLINFGSQLLIDLLFSFFSHKINIHKSVRLLTVLAVLGLLFYACAPLLFPNAVYLGIAIGTVIFSASSGLTEVLLSPLFAALPSENPERDMSKLHSVYAWGVVGVVVFTTLFLLIFGNTNWYFLPLFFAVFPLFSAIAFFSSKLPDLKTPERASGALAMFKSKTLWTCIIAIFLGGACELIMTQWSSSYLEQALGIEKVWGDIFGAATFALALGLGRTLYAKRGKNLERVLLFSAVGTAICYAACVFIPIPLLGLIACAATGFCVAMMWPGCLVVAAKQITTGGVFIYAIMAAGGDLGAAIGPQLTGIVTDAVRASAGAEKIAARLGLTVEQLGMKAGMCLGLLVALFAVVVFWRILRASRKREER